MFCRGYIFPGLLEKEQLIAYPGKGLGNRAQWIEIFVCIEDER